MHAIPTYSTVYTENPTNDARTIKMIIATTMDTIISTCLNFSEFEVELVVSKVAVAISEVFVVELVSKVGSGISEDVSVELASKVVMRGMLEVLYEVVE